MDISTALDAVRTGISGCTLVAFADINSKLVLSSSAAVTPSREDLDILGEAAGALMTGGLADGATKAVGATDVAITLTATELRLFLRASQDANEALVCVCDPACDMSAALAVGQNALTELQAAG